MEGPANSGVAQSILYLASRARPRQHKLSHCRHDRRRRNLRRSLRDGYFPFFLGSRFERIDAASDLSVLLFLGSRKTLLASDATLCDGFLSVFG